MSNKLWSASFTISSMEGLSLGLVSKQGQVSFSCKKFISISFVATAFFNFHSRRVCCEFRFHNVIWTDNTQTQILRTQTGPNLLWVWWNELSDWNIFIRSFLQYQYMPQRDLSKEWQHIINEDYNQTNKRNDEWQYTNSPLACYFQVSLISYMFNYNFVIMIGSCIIEY